MAITKPQAVRFSNERLRVAADAMQSAYLTARRLVEEFDGHELAGLFPDSAVEVVDDGADRDGRPPMTGARACCVIECARALIAFYEDGVEPRKAHLARCAVNGAARF